MKAKYIGKYIDKDDIYLKYEYRGQEYYVHENRAKGNEPLSWQHQSEQYLIDQLLDNKSKATEDAQIGLDLFFNYVNGETI